MLGRKRLGEVGGVKGGRGGRREGRALTLAAAAEAACRCARRMCAPPFSRAATSDDLSLLPP
eukprot:3000510-Rhodomonas_salina.2